MADKDYSDIIVPAAAFAAGLGTCTAFAPGADMAGVSTTWVTMMIAIAKRSEHDLDALFCGKVAAAVVSGVAGYWAGSKLFTGVLFYAVPGAGTVTAATVNGLLNGLYTWRLGTAFVHLFDKPGFDPRDARAIGGYLASAMRPIPTMVEARHIWAIIHHGYQH